MKSWAAKFRLKVARELKKLDKKISTEIFKWIKLRINYSAGPRLFAEQLSGSFKDFWRFSIGNYRVVFKPETYRLVVLIVRIAFRKHIYKDI